jgi:hypothetical protein
MIASDAPAMDAPAFLGASMSNAALATRPALLLGSQPGAAVLALEIITRAEGAPAPEPPPPPLSIIRDGLVLHYDIANPICYAGSGLAISDLSGSANHGTLTGNTAFQDSALAFDGSSNITTATLVSNPQSFSIGIWFRTSAPSGRKLVGLESSQIGGSGSYDRHFYVDTAGQLRWGVWSPGSSTFLYGNVTDNQWRYAVVSFNNGATLHSLNGQGLGTIAAASQPFDGYWRIAGQSLNFWPAASAGFFIGQIAGVEIYNRPLGAGEIEQNFNINRGRFGL